MNVFDLCAKLTLDSSEYEQGLDESGKKASSFGDKLGKGLKAGGAAIAAVGTATVAMRAALTKATGDTAAYGDNIDKMSQKLGVSAEAYQEWDAILRHSGASIESMQSGMKTLAVAAENGSEAFDRLGLSQEQIAGMSQEELFSATITALQNVESETERTYLASKLLGKGGTELGALLNTSAAETEEMRKRVHELGGVMSDDAVKAAAHYQDSLQDMQTAFEGLGRGLTSEFMPGITTVIDGLTEIFTGNGEGGLAMISDGINGLVETIAEQLPQFLDLGLNIINSLSTAIITNLPVFASAAIDIILSLTQNIVKNLPTLLTAAMQILFALSDGIVKALPTLIPAIVSVILAIVEKLTEPNTILALVNAAFSIMGALLKGLIQAIPQVIAAVPVIINNILSTIGSFLGKILNAGADIVKKLASGISQGVSNVIQAAGDIISGVWNTLMSGISAAKSWGQDLVANFINGIISWAGHLWDTVKGLAQGIRNILGFSEPKEGPLSNFHTYAPDMVKLFAQGVEDNEDMLKRTVEEAFDFSDVTVAPTVQSGKSGAESAGEIVPINITVQSVLDGKVIGETSYRYNWQKARAFG